MKKIILILISAHFLFSGCGTLFRLRMDGDLKKAVNVAISDANKDIKIYQNNLELPYKIVYNGAKKSSPFTVRRYFLSTKPESLSLEIEKNGKRQKVVIPMKTDKITVLDFYTFGLFVLVDAVTGSNKYYQDITIY